MSKIALVVDDSKSARYALRKFLEGFNYKVETAESASEAYRILAGLLPEVIFMDHIMPGVDGFEALGAIKSEPRTADIPVVICSSNEGADFTAQAMARGASNVLQKPPHPEQLSSVLASLGSRAPQHGSSPLPHTTGDTLPMAATQMPRRESTAMQRLLAAIPPKFAPAPALSAGSLQPPADSPLTLPDALSPTLPLPTIVIPPPAASKVQSLREPSVTIQQAVMRSIRDSMPQEQQQAPASIGGLPLMPALTADSDVADALTSLREEMDQRMGSLRQELMSELGSLRSQLAGFNSNALDEKLRLVASEAAKARTNALASSLEQHLSALRGNLDAILRAQNERIEQLLQTSRQTAAEEAERTVMKAAQRISDQMAESILKTLGPQLSKLRQL